MVAAILPVLAGFFTAIGAPSFFALANRPRLSDRYMKNRKANAAITKRLLLDILFRFLQSKDTRPDRR